MLSRLRNFWRELIERFGVAHQPLVYQLNRGLTLLGQENNPVSIYFSKLKMIWDELQELEEFPKCACAASKSCTSNLIKKIQDMDSRNKLFRFLMGLNSSYGDVRDQILAMDPLPSVSRAYYIIQQTEKQRKITNVVRENKKLLLMLHKNKDRDLNLTLETKGIARKERVTNFAKLRDIKWTNVSNYMVTLIGTKKNMGPRWLHKFQFKTTLS